MNATTEMKKLAIEIQTGTGVGGTQNYHWVSVQRELYHRERDALRWPVTRHKPGATLLLLLLLPPPPPAWLLTSSFWVSESFCSIRSFMFSSSSFNLSISCQSPADTFGSWRMSRGQTPQ